MIFVKKIIIKYFEIITLILEFMKIVRKRRKIQSNLHDASIMPEYFKSSLY